MFSLPVEHVIGWGRVFLGIAGIMGVSVDIAAAPAGARSLLVLYALFAAVWLFIISRRPERPSELYIVHAVDLAISGALLYLTEGSTSPFFVFFTFTLLAATLRWNWQGALVTTGALTFLLICDAVAAAFGAASDVVADLSRTIIRAGFLLACGLMLGYAGAYRERARCRFQLLAAWPAITSADVDDDLQRALGHAAKVMRASEVLAIWDDDEPCRHVALWSDGKLRCSREQPGIFGSLVDEPLSKKAFVAGPITKHERRLFGSASAAIDRDLRRTFKMDSAITAPFETSTVSGRIFVMNRPLWSDEDLALIEIVAARIGGELERRTLQRDLEASIVLRERARVGRDMHDGVLQGLAAVSMHLKSLCSSLPETEQRELNEIRGLLLVEAQRVRSFVEESRSIAEQTSAGMVELRPQLDRQAELLGAQWNCGIETTIDPQDLTTSVSTGRAIRHLVTEAVSNAIRHGHASQVRISVSQEADMIQLTLRDNGNGFENLSGSYRSGDLELASSGPQSLRSRVEDLGGVLYLTSSSDGAEIAIEFPR
jgi:signal transduction histidine kinase